MRMKAGAVLKTEQDLINEREAAEAEREIKERKAMARKKKMLEMEAEAKAKAKKSDLEVEKIARDQQIRQMAEAKMTEETDLVKLLNTLGARAAAFTIRDQQLENKKRQEESELEYERRMEMLMELNRLKDLQRQEAEEAAKAAKRVEDRRVIEEQIAAREKRKLLAEEAREQENKAMLAQLQKFEAGRESARRRAAELEATRWSAAARRGARTRAPGRRREEAILAYQVARATRSCGRARRGRRPSSGVDEGAAGCCWPSRSAREQAGRDGARVARAPRRRSATAPPWGLEAAKRRADVQVLQGDRRRQAAQKRNMMEKEAEQQLLEYEAAMAHAARASEREAAEAARKRAAADTHRREILAQVEAKEQARRLHRNDKFEEGAALKQEFSPRAAEAIRDKMVEDMAKKGVNPKYLAEMRAADIQKLQMR
ncbi:unnamed protein product [Heterosigma akashiwo]